MSPDRKHFGKRTDPLEIRRQEETGVMRLGVTRYNSAIDHLNKMGLDPVVQVEIRSAIRGIKAYQKAKDDILWRRALLDSGMTLRKIDQINTLKESLETQIEIKEPEMDH